MVVLIYGLILALKFISTYSKLKKTSNLGTRRARFDKSIRDSCNGIYSSLTTYQMENSAKTVRNLKPQNFNWPPTTAN